MVDDQYDYYMYSLRKVTLIALEGLMNFNSNELFQFKSVIKATLGLCKLSLRVSKNKDEEIKRFAPLFEEYKKSEDYLALQKEVADTQEEEEFKKDADPKGYIKYNDFVRNI